ncbi:hypothetical protein FJTKL_14998 [Diaporthe vaccinii]|uniref:FAD dependent oxidoreductase domain-containing protein n=1 Tax=Diaporthe vaccinii TaxID=105482 RepID=A0ABR4E6I6_9PEZI
MGQVYRAPRFTPAAERTSKVTLRERQSHIKYETLELSTDDEPLVKGNDQAKPNGKRHVLIIGGGVSGLLPAWMLLDKGYRVTIIAEHWAWTRDFEQSRITSQIAGALWEFPPGGCGLTEIETPGPGFATVEHYREWSLQSYEFYKKYHNEVTNSFEKEGYSFGLRLADLNQFFYKDVVTNPDVNDEEYLKFQALKWAEADGRVDKEVRKWDRKGLETGFGDLVNLDFDKERAGQFKSGYTHMAPIINTDKAMSYLMALIKSKRAVLETRPFKGLVRDFGEKLLEEHKAHAIINATGLGAKELASDDDVYPVRGAIKRIENTRKGEFRHLNDAFLVPAQRDLNGNPTKTVLIVPRSDDVLYVGSIIQPEATEKLSQDSIEVEGMWDVRADDNVDTKFPLVHNYGHGGSGWTLGVGTARCAVHIVEQFMGLNAESLLKPIEALKVNISTLENVTDEISTANTADQGSFPAIKERAKVFVEVWAQASKAAAEGASGAAQASSTKASPEALMHWQALSKSIPDPDSKVTTATDSIKNSDKAGDVLEPAIKTLTERTAEVKNDLAALEKVLENDENIRLLDYRANFHKKAIEINKQLYGEATAVAAH